MNIFVYRDTFFQFMGYPGEYVLLAEAAPKAAKEWDFDPPLLEIREAADEYVSKRVLDASRASGDAVCEVCTKYYRRHPDFRGAFFMEHPYLTRLCDGSLVKL